MYHFPAFRFLNQNMYVEDRSFKISWIVICHLGDELHVHVEICENLKPAGYPGLAVGARCRPVFRILRCIMNRMPHVLLRCFLTLETSSGCRAIILESFFCNLLSWNGNFVLVALIWVWRIEVHRRLQHILHIFVQNPAQILVYWSLLFGLRNRPILLLLGFIATRCTLFS